MKYKLPYFGELDLDALEEYYQVEIEFEGREIELDLNFESETIDPEKMEVIKGHLENLSDLDAENSMDLEKDYKEGQETKNYIEEQLSTLDEEDLKDILGEADKTKSKPRQMLETLHLVRVGFYPDVESSALTFDYTLSEDYVDDILVVFRENSGELNGITIES